MYNTTTCEDVDLHDLLIGKTLTKIARYGSELQLTLEDGRCFEMYHRQSCCESVTLEEVVGDLDDLIGAPLLLVEESSSGNVPPPHEQRPESYTWTFYRLGTIKGSVVLRWYGESNGYYSESVDIRQIDEQPLTGQQLDGRGNDDDF